MEAKALSSKTAYWFFSFFMPPCLFRPLTRPIYGSGGKSRYKNKTRILLLSVPDAGLNIPGKQRRFYPRAIRRRKAIIKAPDSAISKSHACGVEPSPVAGGLTATGTVGFGGSPRLIWTRITEAGASWLAIEINGERCAKKTSPSDMVAELRKGIRVPKAPSTNTGMMA